MKISIREDSNPFFARIIIGYEWNGDSKDVIQVLEKVCESWPKNKRVKFIVTSGGFLQFNLPKSIQNKSIKEIRQNELKYIDILSNKAKEHIQSIFNKDILLKLSKVSDYISLGIDSRKEKISIVQNYIKETHVELVFLINLRNNEYFWTGKSYPTSGQEKTLIKVNEIKNHFLEFDDVGKIMILGCHDLNIFNNRNWKKTGDIRKNFKIKFRNLAKQEKPTCVLHHPHSTVKIRTWLNSWSNLIRMLPSVKYYAGAGKFYENDGDPSKWDEIYKVIEYNKLGNCIDFILYES